MTAGICVRRAGTAWQQLLTRTNMPSVAKEVRTPDSGPAPRRPTFTGGRGECRADELHARRPGGSGTDGRLRRPGSRFREPTSTAQSSCLPVGRSNPGRRAHDQPTHGRGDRAPPRRSRRGRLHSPRTPPPACHRDWHHRRSTRHRAQRRRTADAAHACVPRQVVRRLLQRPFHHQYRRRTATF